MRYVTRYFGLSTCQWLGAPHGRRHLAVVELKHRAAAVAAPKSLQQRSCVLNPDETLNQSRQQAFEDNWRVCHRQTDARLSRARGWRVIDLLISNLNITAVELHGTISEGAR